jgi:predicted O-linked N-acetylglucosamine transferase (SPINDLY family)
MHRHTVGKILIGWLRSHDRHRFDVHGYYIKAKVDTLTREMAANCHQFHHIPGDIEATARQITADRLHLLIYTDIGMHPPATMLAAMRLAPIQCKAWGHPVTTGLPTMDYYLSSDLMEPEDGQAHYRETLVRLPNLALVHRQDPLPQNPKTRRDLGLPVDAFIYLTSQSLFKYLPQYDFVYPRIAKEVPGAHFVFIAHASAYVTRAFEERLKAVFQQYNLAFPAHCTIMPRMGKSDFLALNGCCDTLLDTFEWSGGNTTMEGIASGLPAVVTCPGRFMRGRHTYAMLTKMGITDTVAENPEAYIKIAVRLGTEPEFFRRVQSRFNAGRHLLFDDATCVPALERFYARAVSDKLTGADSKHASGE